MSMIVTRNQLTSNLSSRVDSFLWERENYRIWTRMWETLDSQLWNRLHFRSQSQLRKQKLSLLFIAPR